MSAEEERFIFFVGVFHLEQVQKSGMFWLPLPQTQEADGLGWCLLNRRSEHTAYQARTSAAVASAFCLPFSCECLLHTKNIASFLHAVLFNALFPLAHSFSVLHSFLRCSLLYFVPQLNGCLFFDCRDCVVPCC